jgi:hypothetical protein
VREERGEIYGNSWQYAILVSVEFDPELEKR